ncbi:MAG: heparinase II/III family protein [Cellulosilyticaceae bacterium]
MGYFDQLPLIAEEKCLEIADDLLSGKLIVHETNKEYATFASIETINWGIELQRGPNTYQLFLQGLNAIAFLVKAYQISQESSYLLLAQNFITSWCAYERSRPRNAFLWNDHAVAMRTENLIYFATVATQSKGVITPTVIMEVKHLIKNHAEYMYNDLYYTWNHNHGIMQDCALIYSAYYLNDQQEKSYIEKAKQRLCMQIEYGFNKEAVHIENSPGYQSDVVMILEKVAACMNMYKDPFGTWIYEKISKYTDFLIDTMKPDCNLAEIGDTSSGYGIREKFLGYKLNNQELLYATTYGKEGIMPMSNTKIYPQSGYYLYRESWKADYFDKATWVAFKAGYHSKTHKHADDLSFMFYSKGMDIFVDPGWYNYVYGDPLREYFISARAHNTVIVDGQTYSPTVSNDYKTGMLKYEITQPEYDYVLAFNKMYKGVEIDRHFYYLKEDSILLYDEIISEEEHTYSQLFHTSETIEVISNSDSEVLLRMKHTPYSVRITQLTKETHLEIYQGDAKNQYGHLSRGLNCVEQNYTLKFDKVGNKTSFLTLITIEDEKGTNQAYQNYRYDAELEKIYFVKNSIKQYAIQLKKRKRIGILGYHMEMMDIDVVMIQVNAIGDEGLSYAWYILEEENGNVEYKQMYTKDNILNYQFKNKVNYIIKLYLKSQQGEVVRQVIAQINYENGYYQDVTAKVSYRELMIDSCQVEQIADHHYRFKIIYEYFWKTSVKWYIYRNGSYYKMIRNSETMEYVFKEPGVYTVMYYLRTLNGEEEFWTVPSIQI